ncbi:MAG: chromate transporter [Bacteroidales bacterium]|nr:chromate transporter [Bacteroidales bacterium]
MIYLQLFLTFFKIGLFGFGGGYAMLSMIQYEIVEHHAWLTSTEFTNMVAVSQITPGPIGINSATYAGFLATGNVLGSAVATLAIMLPSFIIVALLALIISKVKNNVYFNGAMRLLRIAVIGLIAAAALLLINEENFGAGCRDIISWLLFAATFVATKWLKVHPILAIVIAAVVGIIIY